MSIESLALFVLVVAPTLWCVFGLVRGYRSGAPGLRAMWLMWFGLCACLLLASGLFAVVYYVGADDPTAMIPVVVILGLPLWWLAVTCVSAGQRQLSFVGIVIGTCCWLTGLASVYGVVYGNWAQVVSLGLAGVSATVASWHWLNRRPVVWIGETRVDKSAPAKESA